MAATSIKIRLISFALDSQWFGSTGGVRLLTADLQVVRGKANVDKIARLGHINAVFPPPRVPHVQGLPIPIAESIPAQMAPRMVQSAQTRNIGTPMGRLVTVVPQSPAVAATAVSRREAVPVPTSIALSAYDAPPLYLSSRPTTLTQQQQQALTFGSRGVLLSGAQSVEVAVAPRMVHLGTSRRHNIPASVLQEEAAINSTGRQPSSGFATYESGIPPWEVAKRQADAEIAAAEASIQQEQAANPEFWRRQTMVQTRGV